MIQFIPGQRVISDAELQMGLGTVLSVEQRTVTVLFLATGETRTYATQTAPLTRVAFVVGDTITSHDGTVVKVTEVHEADGLLSYIGTDSRGVMYEVEEAQLDNAMQLNRPSERLFNGQIDSDKWFELRYQTQSHLNRLAHSDLYGLTGGRTSLIPHQLYIAHEVANRFAPRVLLADEVGLGKTIEAGMILHHQLLTERAHRILIVVPETLVHQWLVEMLRRFNLHFKIFDDARFTDLLDSEASDFAQGDTVDDNTASQEADAPRQAGDVENPFLTEQLVLCSLDFLTADKKRFAQCMAGEWDLLIVDEAHHLQWAPEHASHEYQLIEQLATETKGVLLLTATPEQLGKASHFARLRLLDPDRFHDYDSFVAEEKTYEPVAQVVEDLLEDKALTESDVALIESTFAEGDNRDLLRVIANNEPTKQADHKNTTHHNYDDATTSKNNVSGTLSLRGKKTTKQPNDETTHARLELVEHLLDRHGTGRVLFRNTRAAVKGFPERLVRSYPLPLPDTYKKVYELAQGVQSELLLVPECLHQALSSELSKSADNHANWNTFDPRIEWLSSKLTELYPEKVLVIAASADTALDIAGVLKHKAGIHAAVFHEGLSIVERDKAAAYFADHETGAQVLVCSEIGSEGRNFQFAHHLVLFDLPFNPDLLEQRIGRLDRIGQTETIQIHVPYLESTAQDVMFHWYHNGLNAFEHTCPAGHAVFVKVFDQLQASLQNASHNDALIAHTKTLCDDMIESLHKGRDRLLEYNSCRQHVAQQLKQRVIDADDASPLTDYMENVFDCFGVDTEIHSENCFIVRPTEHMAQQFPGLYDDGMTITYTRDTALTFEDAHYLSWEHPMVRDAMDLVMMQEKGNTAVTAIKSKVVPAGSVLLECIFIVEAAPVEKLQTWRYLPPTTVRVVLDEKGNNYTSRLPHENLNNHTIAVDTKTAVQVVRAKLKIMKSMHQHAEKIANAQVQNILDTAHNQSNTTLLREINRLKALQKVNPNVRDSEIEFYQQQLQSLNTVIDTANLRLDAIRAIVVT